QAVFDFDSGGAKSGEAGSSGLRVGIFGGGDDASDAGGDDRFGAGPSASGMIARLEGHIKRGAARAIAGLFQRDDFRMVSPVVLAEAFADDGAILDDDAADRRVRAGQADTFAREVQGVFHEALIVGIHGVS